METPEQAAEKNLQQESYSDEDILTGKIYPPPPSFYQKQPAQKEKVVERQVPPTRYFPEAAQAKIAYVSSKGNSDSERPPYRSGNTSGAVRTSSSKRPRRWIWVVASILASSLIVSCSLCGWAGYNLFSAQLQEMSGARDCVNGYYHDMQARNYLHAYTYLMLTGTQSALSSGQFVQQAQQQDAAYGPILSYTPDTPNFRTDGQGTDINGSTITVDIGRKHKQYTVTLSLSRQGNIWKIVKYNEL